MHFFGPPDPSIEWYGVDAKWLADPGWPDAVTLADSPLRVGDIELSAADVEVRRNAMPAEPVRPNYESLRLTMVQDTPWKKLMGAIAVADQIEMNALWSMWEKLGNSSVLQASDVAAQHNACLGLAGFVMPGEVDDTAIAAWNSHLVTYNINSFSFRNSTVAAADSEPIASMKLSGG